jgi:hypothetical protein
MPGKPPFESILFALIVGECNIINQSNNQSNNQYIRTQISPDGHTLVISNISEEDIGKLVFPTNTDNNNNKLSLVNVSVYVTSNPTLPVTVPGLTQQLIYAFNNSNSRGFRNLDVVHKPFAEIPAGSFSYFKPTLTTPQLTDTLAGITTFTQPTRGQVKLFAITLTNSSKPTQPTQQEWEIACNNKCGNYESGSLDLHGGCTCSDCNSEDVCTYPTYCPYTKPDGSYGFEDCKL